MPKKQSYKDFYSKNNCLIKQKQITKEAINMKIKIIIIAAVSTLISFQALSWGKTGHRVTGAIAQWYLTSKAQAAINNILLNEDLAEASTYPDEMRSNPSDFWKKTASPWHYVNVHAGKKYADVGAPPEGDAVTALTMFSKQLTNPKSTLAEKQLALKFIVHIVGDLHQPVHSGSDLDKGGNDIKMTFFWKKSNLHRIWDSGLIDRQKLSYSEWAQILNRKITPQQAKEWMVTDPTLWVAESVKLREGLYPTKDKIAWDYQYQNVPVLKQRLEMAGVRLAAYLNNIFK